ncbi:hypothetical protein LO762_02120 [Actinocorallia sp. API 0066]|uniref:hypothetical protein n=1 Tax=Actinocorallia sp. API 0066 TaxID=2896846 RepID=UPI001E5516DD|nr:hypothetical protein [Actinocorallia sp. API 0066]MCD0447997.1 hypothetical protein [Actinocorallia sp. API 0066]
MAAPASAAPPEPKSRADLVAEALAKDPVQITDHAPRAVEPDAKARIVSALEPLGVPYYVVVVPSGLFFEGHQRPRELVPILHDRLGKDGVYLVTDTSGSGEARHYGGSLPVLDAWRAARSELGYDAGPAAHIERFGQILAAPDPAARIAASTPAPRYVSRSDARDRAEMAAMAAGTGVGALLVGVPLLVSAVRGRRRASASPARIPPTRGPAKPAGNKGGKRKGKRR